MRIRSYEYVREQAASYNYPCTEKVASSETVAKIMRDCFKIDKQVKEHFYTITLDTKLKITGVLGIKLIDHIIVAGGNHTSFKANGLM